MINDISGFDWDVGNIEHCQKHGVTVAEIEEMFFTDPAIFDDPHIREKRFRAIGKNRAGRFIYVVFMVREKVSQNYIRPISARYMHRKEIETYEKT